MTKTPATKIGKGNTLFYALVVTFILAWQSVKVEYKKPDGWTFQSQTIPIAVLTPCLVVMGVALGINIRQEMLILAAFISRNSEAIADLAEQQKNQQQLLESTTQEIEQSTNVETNDSKKLL